MSTEVEPVTDRPALTAMVRDLAARVKIDEMTGANRRTTDEFVMDVMESILTATSFEEIFAAQDAGGVSGQDFVGRPFIVRSAEDIEWLESTYKNEHTLPAFARIQVTEVATGEHISLACGGNTFICTLKRLQDRGYFDTPQQLVIVPKNSPAGSYLQLKPYRRSLVEPVYDPAQRVK